MTRIAIGVDDEQNILANLSNGLHPDFAVVSTMVGGAPDDQIEGCSSMSVTPSVPILEQSKPPEYLARQIAKAPKAAPTPTWPTDDGIDR